MELPEGFTWQDADTTSVGNAGTNSFMVTFTPDDTANYEIVEDIEVTLEVAKATPKVSPIIPEGEYTEGNALPEIGYESEISGIIEWLTELVNGLIEGENELEWQFTPDDDNYEIVTGTAVVEAQATTTTTTTSETTTTTTTTTQPTTTSTTTTTTEPTTTSTTTTSTTTTETTTSSTTTSTTTETTTSSTTTSTTTETTTSSTTTSTTTETTTSSTTTSTTTETTTSSTTTSTTTETTTSSTTTSTTTETTTSSTTTSTTTETTTSSTNTSTTTETTTSSTSTSTSTQTTTTTTTHIASDEELCDWAVKDYAKKNGVTPENAEIEYTADGNAVITLTNAEGNVLNVYTIDPTTGVGTETDGGEVNLPQTGYSVVYNYIMFAAAAMVLFGIFAMAKSRKRDEE